MLDTKQPSTTERTRGMDLSNRTIVGIFIAGCVLAWMIGEIIGGWPGELTAIEIILAIGGGLWFACRHDE